jgi:hypothetical protein
MTREEHLNLLPLLGILPLDWQRVQRAPNLEAAKNELEHIKERAKKAFKKLALELHPDMNGGDEEKTVKFKQLNEALQILDKLQIRPPPRPPPPMARPPMGAVFIRQGGVTFSSGTSGGFNSASSVTIIINGQIVGQVIRR